MADTRTQKRRGLQHWLMYCEHRRDVEQVKERALSLRLTNLVRRHIRNWNSKTLVNSERRESEEQALEIAHRSRLCSAFYAWKGCHDLAEYWKAQERFGDQMYQETLLARSFVHWNVQWQLKETLAWHDDNATVFYNRTRVAHCLHTWKVMHLQHQVTANQMELAEWTYRRRVLTLLTRKWRTSKLSLATYPYLHRE